MAALPFDDRRIRMDRRTFARFVAGTGLLAPLALRAQQAGSIARIGLLAPATEGVGTDRIDLKALRAGLRDRGWVEGRNLSIETAGRVSPRSGSANSLPS
jgi:hypothetical protein